MFSKFMVVSTVLVAALFAAVSWPFFLSISVADAACYTTSLNGSCQDNVGSISCEWDTYCDITYGAGGLVIRKCQYASHVPVPITFPPGGSCAGHCVLGVEDAYISVASEASQGWDLKFDYEGMTPCQKVYRCKCAEDDINCETGIWLWDSTYEIQESYADGEGCGGGGS